MKEIGNILMVIINCNSIRKLPFLVTTVDHSTMIKEICEYATITNTTGKMNTSIPHRIDEVEIDVTMKIEEVKELKITF